MVVHDSEQLGGGLVLQPDVDLVPELPLDAVEQLPSDLGAAELGGVLPGTLARLGVAARPVHPAGLLTLPRRVLHEDDLLVRGEDPATHPDTLAHVVKLAVIFGILIFTPRLVLQNKTFIN